MTNTIKLNGFLHDYSEVETVSKTGNKFQRLRVRVPGRQDEFGEKKTEDQIFEVTVFSPDKITEVWQGYDQNSRKKLTVECFVNGSSRQADDGRTFYNTQLRVKSLKWLSDAAANN